MNSHAEIDLDKLAAAIRTKRGKTGLRAAAAEIGSSAPTLSRVEQGRLPDLDTFIRICRWLGQSPEVFSRDLSSDMKIDHLHEIEMHLRADRILPKETADALSKMVRLAFESAKRGRI